MEFGVFKSGGKQYKVAVGDVLKLEKLAGEFKKGDKITFDEVMLLDDGKTTQVGTPKLTGAKIEAEFMEAGRAQKINVIKYKAKSNYYKKRGHRQPFSKVKITKIS